MNTSAQTQLSNTPETTNNRFSNRLTANNPRLAHHQTPNTQNPTNTSRKRVETSRQKTKPDSKTQKYTSQTHSQNQKTALKRSAVTYSTIKVHQKCTVAAVWGLQSNAMLLTIYSQSSAILRQSSAALLRSKTSTSPASACPAPRRRPTAK